MPRNVLITCAPPNPNGDLHLGHLSGPFLGADVLRRYLVARGVPVSYVAYTDDHSCYVFRKGAELGWDAHTTAFRYTSRIEHTLALAGMSPDYYGHPHRDARHDQLVQDHFLRLLRSGVVTEQTLPTPYCPGCGCYRYEAYIRGACRCCDSPSDGTYCEECGQPQEPGGVTAGRCIVCGGETEVRPAARLVVSLAPFAERLAALYEGSPWRHRLLGYCTSLIENGLPVVPISREDGYGIPVPLEGWQGHILDTWFSGIFGYMAATAALTAAHGQPDRWREMWQDQQTELVHFIGFDCGFSHAVLWPAMLLGLGEYITPRYVISNEFYTLNGGKFSTSRGHAIWGFDFLREVPVDAVRLHLCLTAPEEERTDFRLDDFEETLRTLLVAQWEQWAVTVFELLAKEHGCEVPAVSREQWPAAIRELTEQLPARVAACLEPATFSLRGAAALLAEAVQLASRDIARLHAAPADGSRAAAVAAHAELLGTVAAVSAPIMPTWSRHAARQLGIDVGFDGVRWPCENQPLVGGGRRVDQSFLCLFRPRW